MAEKLPQEFPRDLVLLQLSDVLPELTPAAAKAYEASFEARRAAPLAPGGVLLTGDDGLRPLMAFMRLVVLRFRDLNLERFEEKGGEGRYVSSYVKGAALQLVPHRANALFIERADAVDGALAPELARFAGPIFATWGSSAKAGPVWDVLTTKCAVIDL